MLGCAAGSWHSKKIWKDCKQRDSWLLALPRGSLMVTPQVLRMGVEWPSVWLTFLDSWCQLLIVLLFFLKYIFHFQDLIIKAHGTQFHCPAGSQQAVPWCFLLLLHLFCWRSLYSVLAVITTDFLGCFYSNLPFLVLLKTCPCLFCLFSCFIEMHTLISTEEST